VTAARRGGPRPLRADAAEEGVLSRGELIAVLRRRDPLAAARAAGAWSAPAAALPPAAEAATVPYGASVPVERTADRLLSLAAQARATGSPRVVVPVPSEGDSRRPGSWGVEDLTVIAAARAVLPPEVAVRADERRLGRGLCQVAVAFGAVA
jgi:hypothetical protein